MKNADPVEVRVAADGTKRWTKDGRLHREDGPAVESLDGTSEWFFDGKRHRADGPAIQDADGDEEWYRHGERHRENGPAIKSAEGTCHWLRSGKLHREDGPAVEHANGVREYWLNDRQLPFNLWIDALGLSDRAKRDLFKKLEISGTPDDNAPRVARSNCDQGLTGRSRR